MIPKSSSPGMREYNLILDAVASLKENPESEDKEVLFEGLRDLITLFVHELLEDCDAIEEFQEYLSTEQDDKDPDNEDWWQK